jgi:predicted GH43/DUF377 family glycosyl hydrolase
MQVINKKLIKKAQHMVFVAIAIMLLSHRDLAQGTRPTPGPETAAGWSKFSGNPVLGKGLGSVFDVFVIRDGGKYRMYFSWREKKAIALVESDDGIHWSNPILVFEAIKDSDWEPDVNRPAVVKRDDGYHMWYTGQVWDDTTTGRAWIGYATSPDGVHWKRVSDRPVLTGDLPWEDDCIICPHVIWDDVNKQYRMWYSGGGNWEPKAIGYATSTDGIHWNKLASNPIFKPDPSHYWEKERVGGQQVVFHNGWFYMFYIGYPNLDHAQVGIARSKDGITNWQRLSENPIIRTSPDANAVDHNAIYKPFAVWDGKQWLLWYNGRTKLLEQIDLATHAGEDLGFKNK